ncbi:hypothetical protein ACIP5Y_04210 [Nocardia sp. NPDC088792]|uniref:hypothetical protein n=1 Tax=Nocardia sp. NPDC088792 TaxID=3364332 RepID=UPI00382501CD
MCSVKTYGEAKEQVQALPTAALVDFAEAMVVLEVAPWDGDSINDANLDAAFGSGFRCGRALSSA